jgi:hypothetical protein
VKQDLGPGVFLLEAKDGSRYSLEAGDAGLRKHGLKVEVEGELVAGGVGIAVQGKVLKVAKYRLL